jgi:HTH-like domain
MSEAVERSLLLRRPDPWELARAIAGKSCRRRSTDGVIKCGALKEDEAQRLKALEQENARLKKIVAEQALDISLLKDRFLVRRREVSERRACQVVGQHRSTQRYEPQPPELELRLVEPMNELAARHPRYGYRRMWALPRSEGFRVNRKRVSGCGDWRGIACRHDRRSRAARRLRAPRRMRPGTGRRPARTRSGPTTS